MHDNRLTKVFFLGFSLFLIVSSTIASASARSATTQESTFRIIVLSDTQHYSAEYPGIFTNQTEWILENKDALNIKFVIHTGDIVRDADDDTQWTSAHESLSLLDGEVPYGILPGNHDVDNLTEYERYFPATSYENYTYWGGSYGHNTDNYQLFSGSGEGEDFVVLNLGWRPDSDAIAWANGILAKYPERRAIVATHGYLDNHAARALSEFETAYIWEDLIVPNDNVFLVLCGHTHTETRRTDVVDGRAVHQLVADYQDRPNGGNGWLRIIEFRENGTKAAHFDVTVRTYSPFLDRYEIDDNSQFELTEEPLYPCTSDNLLSKIIRALERLKSLRI